MTDKNKYRLQLTEKDIEAGKHRGFVGGFWEEIGQLQFEFLKAQGLQPHHRLIDIGCGALRGGIHFIRYLKPQCYYGIDLNESLIRAAQQEVIKNDLTVKQPRLWANEQFAFREFNTQFDYAIAISLFSHLEMNSILRCLVEIKAVLQGKFFASFFQAPTDFHFTPITHERGGITSYFNDNPFHYSVDEMQWLAARAGLKATLIGDWQHPRNQMMLCYQLE